MSPWLVALAFLGLLFLSAVFSGAETGVYSVNRVRLEAEAEEGKRSARILSRLVADDAGLLITLLVGNNLVLALLTYLTEDAVERWPLPSYAHELVATALLTPAVFLLGELVPKDLFRRRPHLMLSLAAPLLSLFRVVLGPLAWPLGRIAAGLERLFGLRQEEFTRVLGREEMVELLAEGRRVGVLAPHAEELAHSVLVLRQTPLSQVALPWSRVECVDLEAGDAAARAAVVRSRFTRLPVSRLDQRGQRSVVGYVHQLDVLGAPPDAPVAGCVRPLLELAPGLPVDRAVSRLQSAGQRVALLGDARSPLGLVSLMDLLGTIAAQPRFPQPGPVARIGTSP